MSDYGMHPTRYGALSNEELYGMYRESVYNQLPEDARLDLLQETVNRDALERGEIGAPLVTFADLSANESGNAAGGVIQVNRDMAVNGKQTFEYNGQVLTRTLDDANLQALNTVLHENSHCWQDQINDGTIVCSDSALAAQYQANDFTSSAVRLDGTYRLGSHYLSGETANGYYAYYFQATERDAHKYAEEKTNSIIQGLTGKFGTEKSFEAYAKDLEANGYAAMEQRAGQLYQNPNFEKDLNQTLMNQYYGTRMSVDPNTERAVKGEMIASYQAMELNAGKTMCPAAGTAGAVNEKSMEEKGMALDGPVTREEYEASLRDSVNEYYGHAMNDPSMSKEEAISSTAAMAENYLNAMDEFDAAAAQEMDTPGGVESAAVEAGGVETGGLEDGGLDDGPDGGMEGGDLDF